MLTSDEPPTNVLFDYPGADFIFRSKDSHHFRVPKSYIVNSSTVLAELIQNALVPPDVAHLEASSLPVIQLPEGGAILHSLFTFVFPVTPIMPSTTETTMELLSVAQKYQMSSVLSHIRGIISRESLLSARPETSFYTYSLAQKYGLRQEALQAAQMAISNYRVTIEDLDDKLDIVPSASLYELWNYHERVRAILASDLKEFRVSHVPGTLTGLRCEAFSSTTDISSIPSWLDDYIESIAGAPHLFDLAELNTALTRHITQLFTSKSKDRKHGCACTSISSQSMRNFWAALSSAVRDSFEKAKSALSLVQGREGTQAQINATATPPEVPPEPLDMPDPNLIIRSSDLVNFRIHKPVLAMTSPFFRNLLSLPQPSDGETIDGLPVIQLSEDAELLRSLCSMLYPVDPVIPKSYDKVLHLLVACQKYDMVSVQSSIRAHRSFSSRSSGANIFNAYAIANSKGLIPEMESTARLTLDYPMTLETLGEGLRLFEDWALRDLARFRKRCRDNLVACLESCLEVDAQGPSSVWVGCPKGSGSGGSASPQPDHLPNWLSLIFSRNIDGLKQQVFTKPITTPSSIRSEYLAALEAHGNCNFCLRVHATDGWTFWAQLENKLSQARNRARFWDSRIHP